MKLKKFLVVAMSVAMTFAMSTTAFAAISDAEQDLIDTVSDGITTDDGFEFTPSADQIAELKSYFETNDYDDSVINDIIADIDEVVAKLEANNIASVSELADSDILEDVAAMIADSAAKVDLSVTIGDNTIIVTDEEGNSLGEYVLEEDEEEAGDTADKNTAGTTDEKDDTVEQTGFSLASTIVVVAIFAVAFTGCAVYTKKRVA